MLISLLILIRSSTSLKFFTVARKWHSKQSKKNALKSWISLVGVAVLFRVQSYFSWSKVFTLDPKLLFRIQSFYSGSKVITLNPKFQYYSGFKVFTLNTKLLLRIQSFYSRSKVFNLDPKLLLRPETNYDLIQFNIPIPEYEHVTSSSPFNMAAGLGRKRRPKT